MDAAERIRKVLTDSKRQRGQRGPEGQQPLIELPIQDLQELLGDAEQQDQIAEIIRKAVVGRSRVDHEGNRRTVHIQVDDAFHLLEQAVRARMIEEPAVRE